MTKSMMSQWFRLILTVVLIIVGKDAVAAGTHVTIRFSGVATGSSTGTFSGFFIYDQSLPGSAGVFPFQNSGLIHEIEYQGNSIPTVLALNTNCEPFTITTAGTTFLLQTTAPKGPPATQVAIVLPTQFTFSPTSLPLCMYGSPAMPVFPPQALPGSSFTLTGATSFTGKITTVSCSPATGGSNPAPAPARAVPVPQTIFLSRAPVECAYEPACCWTRLFCAGVIAAAAGETAKWL